MAQLTVRDVMHPAVIAVPPDQPLRAIAQTLTDQHVHRVLVTREGRLVGIVSTTDIVRLVANGRLKPG
jgi:CBS domain-containing protein